MILLGADNRRGVQGTSLRGRPTPPATLAQEGKKYIKYTYIYILRVTYRSVRKGKENCFIFMFIYA